MEKVYIGIDNGVSGSIGILTESNRDNLFIKTPVVSELDYTKEKKKVTRLDVRQFYNLLVPFVGMDCVAILERPMVFPGRWVATLSAIRCHEATIIILDLIEIPYIYIDSREWQKVLLPKDCEKEMLKKESLKIGNTLYPTFSNVKHPDRDGLLIAEYYKRKYEGKV